MNYIDTLLAKAESSQYTPSAALLLTAGAFLLLTFRGPWER